MVDEQERLIVVRPASEVSLKARRTRDRFMRTLRSAVLDALQRNGVRCRVNRRTNRLLVWVTDGPQEVAEETIGRIFGVGSYSPVRAVTAANAEVIAEEGHRVFSAQIGGRSFAVRAKRFGEHPFSSMDVARKLGAALSPYGPVDLTNPQVEIRVEVMNDKAYLFEDKLPGIGGLPLGTEAKALSLLSGGFDSAVASHEVMRRGVALDFVLFNLAGGAYERLVTQAAKLISDRWAYGTRPSLYVIDFTDVVLNLRSSTREDYWQVLLKRLMYRAAAQLGESLGAQALVTGESIGQVSSQTLANLRAIEEASPMPVLRPLVAMDKREIMERAKNVGTDVISARVQEYCAITTGRPVVAASLQVCNDEEAKLDPQVLGKAVEEAKRVKLQALNQADLMLPYLFTDEVPEGATLVDCQAPHHFEAWRVEDAPHFDPLRLLNEPKLLDKSGKYVLYCGQGTQSAQVAEVLQQLGYEAYSFRGGTKALRRYLEESRQPVEAGS